MHGTPDLRAIEARLVAVEMQLAGLNPAARALLEQAPIADIAADAAFAMGLKVRDILGRRRVKRLCRARFAIAWVAARTTDYSLSQIGHCLGGRDHSTIHSARERAEELREKDPAFELLTDRLLANARQRKNDRG